MGSRLDLKKDLNWMHFKEINDMLFYYKNLCGSVENHKQYETSRCMLQNNFCLRLWEDPFVDITIWYTSCTFLKKLVLHYQQLSNSFWWTAILFYCFSFCMSLRARRDHQHFKKKKRGRGSLIKRCFCIATEFLCHNYRSLIFENWVVKRFFKKHFCSLLIDVQK